MVPLVQFCSCSSSAGIFFGGGGGVELPNALPALLQQNIMVPPLVHPTAMKSTVLKFSLVTSALGIVHPDLPSPLAISRGRVRGHSFPQLQLPTNDSGFVHIEAVITDGSPLAIIEKFHASLGRGIESHELNIGNTADNLVGLTGAVNDAGILEKMFSLGAFGAVVRLFDAVRAVF